MTTVVAIGTPEFGDLRKIKGALRKVEDTYRPDYTLKLASGTALSSLVAGAAREQGWTVDMVEVPTACAPDCPPHRRKGGADGTFCVTARRRTNDALVMAIPDVVLCFARPRSGLANTRLGQDLARSLGIAQWTYTQSAVK